MSIDSVEATSPPTSMRASFPNSTPLGFSSQTRPLLCSEPRMADGSCPVTRFSTWLEAPGCWMLTLLPAPIEKPCQFSTVRSLPVAIAMVAPLLAALAWPATTVIPVGSTPASAWAGRACSSGMTHSTAAAICVRTKGERGWFERMA